MEDKIYFYKKNNKREIEPVIDKSKNELAKEKLLNIYCKYKNIIPRKYIENWENVKLYNPSGDVGKAKAILIEPSEGSYDITNKINDLTGKEWTKFTCSWFVFNALQSDLKEEKEISEDTEQHPATYSPTMISNFINFFTKEGQTVLDPFAGIGSTLVACKRTKRIGFGIELNKKYYDLILKRVPEFERNVFNTDCRKIDTLNLPKINFSISSPPYWNMLNRSTDKFEKNRKNKGLDVNYSDSMLDLGNIDDYDIFLKEVCSVYEKMYPLLSDGAYVVIIVKNVKKGGKLYPLAWDMAKILGQKYVLKDEKIWIQDKIGLSPYGYPSSWASNILHHYCIILRKEK